MVGILYWMKMVDIRSIKIAIGFGFIFFGIFWIIFDKYSCTNVCKLLPYPCIWLFMFIGIIFIVCGASLLVMENSPPEI